MIGHRRKKHLAEDNLMRESAMEWEIHEAIMEEYGAFGGLEDTPKLTGIRDTSFVYPVNPNNLNR